MTFFARACAAAAVTILLFGLAERDSLAGAADGSDLRPNILFCISDDQSWLHTGAMGDPVVRTPTFNWVASQGALFTNAYCVTPSCTPSRGTILTGQHTWRLGTGANLHSSLPADLATYPDLLERAGYAVGYTRKGWAPGDWKAGGRSRNPAGNQVKSFDEFLEKTPRNKPFCFWFGSNDPHRPYDYRSGIAQGMAPEAVRVPSWLPDVPEVRSDLLDYFVEIERFDDDCAHLLDLLRTREALQNTVVVVTSDNGMPFPRAKTNLYDSGTHLPLAICWQAKMTGGRTVDDFISFVDFAPTFLDAVGLPIPEDMTGRSFLDLLLSKKSGRLDPSRDHVLFARERHVAYRPGGVGYPARGIRDGNYLYIHNVEPDRWPAGDPPYYVDIDRSPSKYWLMLYPDQPEVQPLLAQTLSRRPEFELYDLAKDPGQLTNVAANPEYAEVARRLAERLDAELVETGDPRALGQPVTWDEDPYYGRDKDAWLQDQDERFEQFQESLKTNPLRLSSPSVDASR